MNASEKELNKNPWRRTDERPPIEGKDLALAIAALLLCALFLGGCIPSNWTWLTTAALFACVVIAVRSTGSVLLLLSITLLASLLTLSMEGGAFVLSIMVGCGSMTWLLTVSKRHRYTAFVVLVAAYGVCWLVSSDPLYSALAFAFAPAAVLMALATVRDVGRTSTVLYTVGGFLISIVAFLCILLFKLYGAVSFDLLVHFVEELRVALVEALRGTGYLLWDLFVQSAEEAKVTAEQMEAVRNAYETAFNEANLQVLVNSVVGLAPAWIFIPTVTLAYGAHLFLLRRYYNTAWRSMLTPASCTVTVSATASVLYFVCFLIVIFIPRDSLFLMAVRNLFLILMPGLCLVGVHTIVFQVRRARGWFGVIWILLLAAMLCCAGFSSLYLLALWGAYAVVSVAIRKKILQKMKDMDNHNF